MQPLKSYQYNMFGCYNIEKIDGTHLKLTKSGGFFGKKKEFFVPESDLVEIVDSVTVKPNNKYKIQGSVKVERVNGTMYKFTGEKGNIVGVPEREIMAGSIEGFSPENGQLPTIRKEQSPQCKTGKYIPYRGPDAEPVGNISKVQPSQPPPSAPPAIEEPQALQRNNTSMRVQSEAGNPTNLSKIGGYRHRMTKRVRRSRRRYSRRRS